MSALIVIILIVFIIVFVVLAVILIAIYNNLVGLRNNYKNSFSQIDVQLKRRHDLIPNLIETVKGYMGHEASTLEAVILARSNATAARENASLNPGQPSAMQHLSGAESMLNSALGRLMMVVEQYPDLKADTHVSQLMEELSSTENRLGFARQAYNDAVTDYNKSREMFPAVLFANLLGFGLAADLWEVSNRQEMETAPPKVDFKK